MESVKFDWTKISFKVDFEIGHRFGELVKLEKQDIADLKERTKNIEEIFESKQQEHVT
jgi:hypothetical protein